MKNLLTASCIGIVACGASSSPPPTPLQIETAPLTAAPSASALPRSTGARVPPVGAACRGAKVDLFAAIALPECSVSAAIATEIGKFHPSLRLTMTVSPARVRYGDKLTVTMTVTNLGATAVPLAVSLQEYSPITTVMFSDKVGWVLPSPAAAHVHGPARYAALVVAPGGKVEGQFETTLKAMILGPSAGCADCESAEAQWDPGAGFPNGHYALRGMTSILIDESDGYAAAVDVGL